MQAQQGTPVGVIVDLWPDGFVEVYAQRPTRVHIRHRLQCAGPKSRILEEQYQDLSAPLWAKDLLFPGNIMEATQYKPEHVIDFFARKEAADHEQYVLDFTERRLRALRESFSGQRELPREQGVPQQQQHRPLFTESSPFWSLAAGEIQPPGI